jgi:hypothetical protein
MAKTQPLKAPAPASGREPTKQVSGEPGSEYLVAANFTIAGPGRYLENKKLEDSLSCAALDFYDKLAPRDAQESMLAFLAVSIMNAGLDCLAVAARVNPGNLPVRELNLRYGLKAAAHMADLIKTLDDRRRRKADKVTVGAVNVEAGGQAIVGSVTSGRDSAPTKETE